MLFLALDLYEAKQAGRLQDTRPRSLQYEPCATDLSGKLRSEFASLETLGNQFT